MNGDKIKCYIYTRVSTALQVDGYSLDAQRETMRKYADFQLIWIGSEKCIAFVSTYVYTAIEKVL